MGVFSVQGASPFALFASPFVAAYALVVAGVLGLVVGSFVNCWAWRQVHGESVLAGRSHCASCGHELGARDLVPLFSWLALKGRCRYCGEKVSARYPLAEAVCAVAFVVIVAAYGLSLEAVELATFAGILLFASLVDIDERIIPDGCIVSALAVRAVYLAVAVWAGDLQLADVGFYVASALGLGVALLVVVLVADRLFGRESMGGGDLKLYLVAGLYFGWMQGVFLVVVSCVIGIFVGVASSRASGDGQVFGQAFPFGPSIAAACVITMLVGDPVVSFYWGLW